jgi:NitT/TauT family transport system ATP-binding protein
VWFVVNLRRIEVLKMGESTEDRPATSPARRPGEVVATLEGAEVSYVLKGPEGPETRKALAGVSLEVREGELLVLVGHSGCGKTTVLNLLAGLAAPTAGRVNVLGVSPTQARSRVGYMFARDALLPWRSAVRNVEFALELRRPELTRRQRKERALKYLEELGVGRSASLHSWQLSQGMRQRVAIARTWAIEPDVLFMDEPFAALDAQTRATVQDMFLELWAADRRTVVFVTHDLDEAILLADRIIVLADGRIVDEMEIDIPRPRDADTLVLEDAYRRLHHRLVTALHHRASGPSANNTKREA